MLLVNINVGALRSPSAFYFSTRRGLEEFNNGWRNGLQPSVCWDVRQLSIGKVNVGAVAFFLSVAHRVRAFTGRKQKILIDWHPKQFSLLSDIGFFDLADEHDLFDWPFDIGGFDTGKINPNTKILSFEKLYDSPDFSDNNAISEWKQAHREQYRSKIVNKCESLFFASNSSLNRNLPLVMSRTCAELVTNSLLWGDSTSFISLQRTRTKIFINVCDIGRGFKFSLNQKKAFDGLDLPDGLNNDLAAIGLGCVINENDFGLKRAISTVLELNGDITISSCNGEVHWAKPIWADFLSDISNYDIRNALMNLSKQVMPFNVQNKSEYNINGFVRDLPSSIRGTRISFHIPLDEEL